MNRPKSLWGQLLGSPGSRVTDSILAHSTKPNIVISQQLMLGSLLMLPIPNG
jgi:hypothetical protein